MQNFPEHHLSSCRKKCAWVMSRGIGASSPAHWQHCRLKFLSCWTSITDYVLLSFHVLRCKCGTSHWTHYCLRKEYHSLNSQIYTKENMLKKIFLKHNKFHVELPILLLGGAHFLRVVKDLRGHVLRHPRSQLHSLSHT